MASEKTIANAWIDYELLDAGGSKKLERFGSIITIRPDVNAYFKSELDFKVWDEQAHIEFRLNKDGSGKWQTKKQFDFEDWFIQFGEARIQLKTTKFKHIGIFPEQEANWKFIETLDLKDKSVLNLFCYTGIASYVARLKGANVTQIDSDKQILEWSKTNLSQSGITDVRSIHDDALKFAQREVKREKKYDLIIMDPPAYGIGAKGERWVLEDKIDELLATVKLILTPNGTLILNTYSPKLEIGQLRRVATAHFGIQNITTTELWSKTKTGKDLFYGNLLRVKMG
jgi:23S rRNA (cytosine1962-C5)-methyltransferase